MGSLYIPAAIDILETQTPGADRTKSITKKEAVSKGQPLLVVGHLLLFFQIVSKTTRVQS
jgi:hypothetical protein